MRSKTEIYLRFFIRRITNKTRGASSARRGFAALLHQIRIVPRALFWLFKNRNYDLCVVVCSGQVLMLDGRLRDEKINYYLSTLEDRKIYIGDAVKGSEYDTNCSNEVLMPLLFFEVIFLPITFLLTAARIEEIFEIKQRHDTGFVDTVRLTFKYATKISKSWCLFLLAYFFKIQKLIVNDGYAQNIEMIDMGNRLLLETVEVQHGIIAAGHYGYSDPFVDFPTAVPKTLVIWNEFAANQVAWRQKAQIIKIHRPSPFVCEDIAETRVTIIGQPSIQTTLLELYSDLNAIYPGSVRYRPHPREKELPSGVSVDHRVAHGDVFFGGFSTMLMDLREHVTDAVFSLECLIPEGYKETLMAGKVQIYRELPELIHVLNQYQFSRSSET